MLDTSGQIVKMVTASASQPWHEKSGQIAGTTSWSSVTGLGQLQDTCKMLAFGTVGLDQIHVCFGRLAGKDSSDGVSTSLPRNFQMQSLLCLASCCSREVLMIRRHLCSDFQVLGCNLFMSDDERGDICSQTAVPARFGRRATSYHRLGLWHLHERRGSSESLQAGATAEAPSCALVSMCMHTAQRFPLMFKFESG